MATPGCVFLSSYTFDAFSFPSVAFQEIYQLTVTVFSRK